MAYQQDLTQGRAGAQLVKYAIPVVISSLLQSAYAMADLILAGWLIGPRGISAINNAGQLTLILTQIILGLCTGGNVLMSQCYGSRDDLGRKRANSTLFAFSMLYGLGAMALFLLLARPMLAALGAPALEEAAVYLRVCAPGMIAVAGYNALSAVIRAVGNSRMPLYCIAATATVNTLLDLLLMGPMRLGPAGAAIATAGSQWASFLICLVYILRRRDLFGLTLRLQGGALKTILKLGLPCSLQQTVGGISWLTVTFLVNQYGVDASAAAGIIVKLKDICQLFTSAMASASATMIAQCLGARKFDRASATVHLAMRISISVSIVLIALVELTAPYLIGLFTDSPAVIAIGAKNLRIEIIAQVFYASFLVYNSLPIAAGHSIFAFASSFLNCIVVRLVLAILFSHLFGLTGVYVACLIAPASSVPLGYFYERSGVWRKGLGV